MLRTTNLRRPAVLLAAAALAAAAAPSAASAAAVTGGHLDWTQYAIYTGATTTVDHTWLGYLTGPSPAQANGTATPIAPATGATVTPSSTRSNTDGYTTVFPTTSGDYDPNTGVGSVQLGGGLDFTAPLPPSGHGVVVTVEQPKVVLNGLTGQLFAHGKGASATPGAFTPYTADQPLYNLDLANATVTLKADGSRVISGIVPSLATANTAFPGNYDVGSGPNRTPNTFGSFSLALKVNAADLAGPAGATGATGPAGATGATGPAGKATTTTIRSIVAYLAKAPFRGTATRKVSVRNAKGTTVATGTVKGRVLKVTLASSVKSLTGTVTLKLTTSKSTAKVKIPS